MFSDMPFMYGIVAVVVGVALSLASVVVLVVVVVVVVVFFNEQRRRLHPT